MDFHVESDLNTNPFPGLRPFHETEEHLFFGRENQVDTMVDKLAKTRFLAVIGASGSGKSSLVNCGLRPALHGGLMASAGTAWRVAKFRPGGRPVNAMAQALAKDDVLFKAQKGSPVSMTEIVESNLYLSKLGLLDVYEQARLDGAPNLLVIVDQFEELFRFRNVDERPGAQGTTQAEDLAAFVNLILEPARHHALPIYVVLTMRSDFLGDCTQFPGLAEAINRGQYLVPRLTRRELRTAISGPVRVGGADLEPTLLTRLVNDVGDNPDQLSILQHALNRTWAEWERDEPRPERLSLKHYESIGTMSAALDQHAERAFKELASEREQTMCKWIFQALTDMATDARGIRRPTKLGLLTKLARAERSEVEAVISVFRKPSRSFLMPPVGEPLDDETVIDISHESLMRVWKRLNRWAEEEANSAQVYRRVADTADLHSSGKASLWQDPDLQLALNWRKKNQPTEAWANRYREGLGNALAFLDASVEERDRVAREAELNAKRRDRLRKILVAVSVFTIVIVGAWFVDRRSNQAYTAAIEARNAVVVAQRKLAEEARENADQARALADSERALADLKTQAAAAVRDAELGDPVRGILRVLRNLQADPQEQNKRSLPDLENALWTAFSSLQVKAIASDHQLEIRAVAFSPDGSHVATGSRDGTVRIYDAETLQPKQVIDEDADDDLEYGSRVLGLAYSPDGRSLATASWSYLKGNRTGRSADRVGRVRLWDPETGALIREFEQSGDRPFAHDGPARKLGFDRTGRHLVTASYDNTARVWDVSNGELTAILAGHKRRNGDGVDVYDVAFHPNIDSVIASTGNDGRVLIWDLASPRVSSPDRARGEMIGGLDASHSGPSAMTLTDSDAIRIIDAHQNKVSSLVFDPKGAVIMTASDDDTIRIWDWTDGAPAARPLAAHTANIWRAVFDGNGETFISVAWDRTVAIWNYATLELLGRHHGHFGPVRDVAVRASDNLIASVAADRTLRLWTDEPRDVIRRKSAKDELYAVAVDPRNPARIATGGDNGTVRFWNIETGDPGQVLRDPAMECQSVNWQSVCRILDLAIGDGGRHVAVRHRDKKLRIWDIEAGVQVTDPESMGADFNLTAVDQDRIALSWYERGETHIELRALKDGSVVPFGADGVARVTIAQQRINRLAFNRSTNKLAIGLRGGSFRILDLLTGSITDPVPIEGSHWFNDLRFSDDGNTLFAALTDWTIRAIDLETNESVATMAGHLGSITGISVLYGGDRLASVSDDETIRIWNTQTGQQIALLPGHTGTIRSVAEIADRNMIVSVSLDQDIVVRRVFPDIWALRETTCDALRTLGLEAGGYLDSGENLTDICP